MISTPNSQEINKNKSFYLAENFLERFSSKEKEVIYAHQLCHDRGIIKPSLNLLAAMARCGRSTVRVTNNKLKGLGLLTWEKTYHHPNRFHVHEILLQPSIRKKIMCFLKNVTLFTLLLSRTVYASDQPLIKIKEFITKEISHSHIVNKGGQGAPMTNFYQKGTEDYQRLEQLGGFDRDRIEKELLEKQRRYHLTQDKLRENAISDIDKALPLTQHGRAKLFSYSVPALRFGLFKVEKCYDKLDPFLYLIGILERYCKENSQYVDRSRYKSICKTFGISRSDDFANEDLLELVVTNLPPRPAHQVERYVGRKLRKEYDLEQENLKRESYLPFEADVRMVTEFDRKEEFRGGADMVRTLPEEQKSWFHMFVIELDEKEKGQG